MATTAEFLEDRLMLSSATPDLSRIIDTAETASPDDYAMGEMLVRFNPGFTEAEKSIAVDNLGGSILRHFDSIDLAHVKLDEPAETIAGDMQRFIADPIVAYAEPNYRVVPLSTPNDPGFTALWGLNNTGQTGGTADADIDAVEAWSDFTGTDKAVVTVIDSGIYDTHPDLADNMWINPGEIAGNGIDDDNNGRVDDIHGYDFSDDDADIFDDAWVGHGSHVAGTIGATGNNSAGLVGVNWDVSLMGAKIAPNAFDSVIIDATNYVTTMRQNFGVNITAINASYGSFSFSQSTKDSIAAVNAAGVVFVAAAGNGCDPTTCDWIGDNNDVLPAYPASYDLDGIISVANTDHKDNRATSSNFGLVSVDLGAPGSSILSTVPTWVNGSGYDYKSGTSMAAPQVTGAVALLRGLRPSLTVQQTKDAILGTVDPIAALNGITVTGGRMNLAAAVTEVAGNVVVSARESLTGNLNDDGTGDEFSVKRDGTDLVLTIDAVESDRVTYSSVTGVAILGSSDDDTLTIDHTGGLIDVPVIYTAFDGANTLQVIGDLDYTLSNTELLSPGAGNVELAYVESVELTGGASANTINASAFTAGAVVLNGLGDNDILLGGAGHDELNGGTGDDTFVAGDGNDTLSGGDGIDQIQQAGDVNQVLTDTMATGLGTDSIAEIEEAQLIGGASANSLNASDFSGGATLLGLDGNDSLWGAAADDSLDGGDGTDQIQQTIDADQVLINTQVTGDGTDTLESIEHAWLIGGNTNNSLDADGFSNGPVTLDGAGGDDTLTGSSQNDSLDGGTGNDLVLQVANTDQVLTNSTLTGRGNDVLTGIELASLTGGTAGDRLDAAGFSGPVTLDGGQGNDTLVGGDDNDILTGGPGTDRVEQAADSNQVLTDNSLTGNGNDTLIAIERALLTGGTSDNTLDSSGFTLGSVTLQGLAGDDTLLGSGGNDLLDGGTGTDQVQQVSNNDQVITDNSLSGQGSDSLASIEEAFLTGGAGPNNLDAAGFTFGGVTLAGGDGDDTLTGSAFSDTLDGGLGIDLIAMTFDGDLVLTNTTLNGHGNDTLIAIERFHLTGGDSANRIDASAYTLGSVTLDGGLGNDTLVGSTGDDSLSGGLGTDTIEQSTDSNMVLTDSSLTGSGTDMISGFEQAVLAGGPSNNSLDASGFTAGSATLSGGTGNDTLAGSQGDDLLDGGDGTDRVVQSADSHHMLFNGLALGHGTDTLVAIEEAHLIGGPGDNTLDATSFTLGPVTLSAGDGDDTLAGSSSDDIIEGSTGIDTIYQVSGNDQVLNDSVLTGEGYDVLYGIDNAVLWGNAAANDIDASGFMAGSVTLIGQSGDDTLHGSINDDSLNGGPGIDWLEQVTDSDQTLSNGSISGHGNDVFVAFERVRLGGGPGNNRLDATDFSTGLVTLEGFAGDDTLLGGQFDDHLDGGAGTDLVEQTANVDQELSLGQLTGRGTDVLVSIESATLTGGESANLLTSLAFTAGPVTLNGAGGDDTLIAGPGDDVINGGSGTDLVRQTTDSDQLLTDSLLTGLGSDTLSAIEQAELTGGLFSNRIDATDFTSGQVTLNGSAGNDTLLGSAGDDVIDGGTGFDQLEQTVDGDQVLTSSSLTGRGDDVLSNIEWAVLTGGVSDNTLDALGFDTGSVTLAGGEGNDTLHGSPGDDRIEGGDGTDLVVSSGDVDQVLSDTMIAGAGNDVLVEIETAHLTGGDSANSLDASGFGGNTTLEGGDGDDTLLGGVGIDLLLQIADADQVLTTTSLSGLGQNTLANIDQARLVGGESNNVLDATAFTPGPVTLDGGGGDDTLFGSAGDDNLQGGTGTDRVVSTGTTTQVLTDTSLIADSSDTLTAIEEAELFGTSTANLLDASGFSGDTTLHASDGDDTLAGGIGTDLVRQTIDADQSITNSQLTGQGTDQLTGIELAWLTGGGNDNTLDAGGFSAGGVTLDGNDGNDTLIGGTGDDQLIGGDGIDQIQQDSDNDQVLTDSLLTGEGDDGLTGIEEAELNGGGGDNLLDATGFTSGSVTLSGLTGNDTLRGSTGDDNLDGGTGIDLVEQTVDADQELTNTQLSGRGTDQLAGIETAHLTGGDGNNLISASSFTLGSVTLDGAAGDDNLTGGSQDDVIIAATGDDVANGRGGDDLISGGSGNDVFSGGAGADTLQGDAGDDTLSGQGGRDQLEGADGDDRLDGGGSPDTVVGGSGDDWMSGGSSGDVLNGSSGDDFVDGGSGSDRIFGGSGADTLDGGTGEDRLNGQGGSGDVVNGNEGDDTVRGGAGDDDLDGGSGYDELREGGDADYLLQNNSLSGQGLDDIRSFETARLTGGGGANQIDTTSFSGPVTLRGRGGDDVLLSASYDDLLLGGNGDDTLDSGAGLDTLNGGAGIDRMRTSGDGDYVITDNAVTGLTTATLIAIETADITGGDSDNVLDASGFSGNTTLWGGGGQDVITGGVGDDWLNGNDGADAIQGGGGDDLLHGGEGADLMIGGDGDDSLNGEAGDDTIDGGAGNDQLIGEEGRDLLLGREGNDSLYGGLGNDQLIGHEGLDRINGESGNDTLLGDEGADTLWGGKGNDVISGDDDNDRLFGQAGNDTLLGESGNDQLQGGSARDVLLGHDGDDTLNGQSGHDTLGAGDGRDRINPHDNSVVINELFMLPGELFDAIDHLRTL